MMQLEIKKYGITLQCDDDLLHYHLFNVDFNDLKKIAVMHFHNSNKKITTNEDFQKNIITIFSSFIKQAVKKLESFEIITDTTDVVPYLISKLSGYKEYAVMIKSGKKMFDSKKALKVFDLIDTCFTKIYNEIFLYLQDNGYNPLNSNVYNGRKKTALQLYKKFIRAKTKLEKSKLINEILTIDPFSTYYSDLVELLDDENEINGILNYCTNFDQNVYSSASRKVVEMYFAKVKTRYFELFSNEKWGELNTLLDTFFWFDKTDYLKCMIDDFVSNDAINKEAIQWLIEKLEKYTADINAIPEIDTLYKLQSVYEKLEALSNKDVLSSGMDYVRMMKLLKFARSYELRDTFFDRYLYSGFITAFFGSGLLWSIVIGFVTYGIVIITGFDVSNEFVTIQTIVTFCAGSLHGGVEWYIMFKERIAWNELTDNGRISLYKVSSEIEKFYHTYIDIQ